MEKVESDLKRSKALREKQAKESQRQLEEEQFRHQQQVLSYTRIISLYFTIRGEHAVTSWTAQFNCMATATLAHTDPVLSNDRRLWRDIFSKETLELLKKGVALLMDGQRCQGSLTHCYS